MLALAGVERQRSDDQPAGGSAVRRAGERLRPAGRQHLADRSARLVARVSGAAFQVAPQANPPARAARARHRAGDPAHRHRRRRNARGLATPDQPAPTPHAKRGAMRLLPLRHLCRFPSRRDQSPVSRRPAAAALARARGPRRSPPNIIWSAAARSTSIKAGSTPNCCATNRAGWPRSPRCGRRWTRVSAVSTFAAATRATKPIGGPSPEKPSIGGSPPIARALACGKACGPCAAMRSAGCGARLDVSPLRSDVRAADCRSRRRPAVCSYLLRSSLSTPM